MFVDKVDFVSREHNVSDLFLAERNRTSENDAVVCREDGKRGIFDDL